jgi:type II secretory pathway component PulC
MKLKSLIKHVNILNIILLSIAIFASYHLYYQVFKAKAVYTIPVKEKSKEQKPQEHSEDAKTISPLEYTIITDQNLFHPERRIPPEKKAGQELPKPEFVLYGTLITGDTKIAYIEDLKAPRTTPGRGKRQTALKIGQTMGGFKLEEIYDDKIVMVRGEEKIEVKVASSKGKRTTAAPNANPAPKSNVSVKK